MVHAPRRRRALAALVLVVAVGFATPTQAQWSRELDLPAEPFYSLHVAGDTIVAGLDSVAYVSTDAGTTWERSSAVRSDVSSVEALWFRDGRIWAGSYGQGVFTSDDFGQSWQDRSAGLAGGLFNSHFFMLDFQPRGNQLYVSTGGAGVFVRTLGSAGPWQPTGAELVANQAGGVEGLSTNGARMLAVGGFNGQVFRNDGGLPWTEMFLDNTGLLPDLGPSCVTWTGSAFLVGTNHGFYRSASGANPWTFVGLNLSNTFESRVTSGDGRTFACLNRGPGATFFWSPDDGAHWYAMGQEPTFTSELMLQGGTLWAARGDGLWSCPISFLDAPMPLPRSLAWRLRGAHPVVGAQARFALTLPAGGEAQVEVFDTSGRRVLEERHWLPAGENEVSVQVQGLASGVYHARVRSEGSEQAQRFVRVRG